MNRSATIALTLCAALTLAVGVEAGHHENKAGHHDKKMDIVDTAVANGSFGTLAAALEAAGLVDALKGDGPFTVFAPTDEAFAKLPAGTVESLLEPANIEQLKSILTYHVVAGDMPASAVTGATGADTLQGSRLAFSTLDGAVKINDAQVLIADVGASNGVIHVIDTVLLPQ
ncbi:MAG: fasciclin domain-containing protein [Acidobacteriota bacterium]|nr:fasciclin domain-containing protein [Acidobacteriota bacterium]MDH3523068.1 fasciclin domain-containing protein [Acidobacteriota bacterium]